MRGTAARRLHYFCGIQIVSSSLARVIRTPWRRACNHFVSQTELCAADSMLSRVGSLSINIETTGRAKTAAACVHAQQFIHILDEAPAEHPSLQVTVGWVKKLHPVCPHNTYYYAETGTLIAAQCCFWFTCVYKHPHPSLSYILWLLESWWAAKALGNSNYINITWGSLSKAAVTQCCRKLQHTAISLNEDLRYVGNYVS